MTILLKKFDMNIGIIEQIKKSFNHKIINLQNFRFQTI